MDSATKPTVLRRLISEEKGQGMTEYTLIISVVAIAVIAASILFRDKIKELFGGATTELDKDKLQDQSTP
jgi:pilus assembly protein Flp/PilA